MSKEIKIRAWSESSSSYIDFIQNTGGTDKNGKDIFDGDIVQTPTMKGVVKFSKEKGQWFIENSNEVKYFSDFKDLDLEITGNKYENPDIAASL